MALSAPLLTRKRCLQVSLETTKGTLLAPATDSLVFDHEMQPTDSFVERKLSGKFLGHSSPGVLEGLRTGECNFKVELRGNGATDLDPSLIILFQCCALKLTTKVYTPTSLHASQKTCSIAMYEDGKKKLMIGCMGTVSFTPADGRIICEFSFMGVWQAPTDAALPTVAYSIRAPFSWGHSSNAFTLATESIKISTFTFNLNNNLVPRVNNGLVEYFMITDRDPTWEIDPESDLVAGYDFYGAWLAGTEVALSLAVTDGTDTVTFAVPKFQYRELKAGDREGIQIEELTGQCNINAINTGDDEFTITAS